MNTVRHHPRSSSNTGGRPHLGLDGQDGKRGPGNPESGLSLVEVAVSMGIFTTLILSVFMTLLRGMEHREQSFDAYRAISALRDIVADIQETANLPQDLTAGVGIGAIYLKYNGQTFAVPDVQSGQIIVACYPNETAVPAILGGPQDLNFDGDANDDLGNASLGTDLKLVPVTLTLGYTSDNVARTMVIHRLITKSTD